MAGRWKATPDKPNVQTWTHAPVATENVETSVLDAEDPLPHIRPDEALRIGGANEQLRHAREQQALEGQYPGRDRNVVDLKRQP